ncbi:MAG: ABC-2 transporter permease [Treponema sp.]|nr:ABC-2 transporter permease [Treponema sp.]
MPCCSRQTYPSIVAVFYCLLSILNTFRMITVNKDNDFTMSLPVPCTRIVLTKYLLVAIIEVSQLVVAIPFALYI